jgi:hypothetical protein
MNWWFGIFHLNKETPTLYGPYPTNALADKDQGQKWLHRFAGEHTSPPFCSENEETARQEFLFTSLSQMR